jgi:hypothetical protein
MRIVFIISVLLLVSCRKQGREDWPNTYQDGFESYNEIEDIIDGDNEQWSFFQQTYEENELTIDTTIYHTGGKSVKSSAVKTMNGNASKCSINKQFMAFWEGETVVVDFWMYLEGNESCEWLFLFDLEEKVPVGAGPGMRLALVENQITLEHKFPNPNVFQPEATAIDFPRDQWVNVRFETKLSRKKNGYVIVHQDGVEIINQQNWQTLPKDILYFNQGTRGGYSQIEFGITANTSDNDMVMYVDDVNVYKKD